MSKASADAKRKTIQYISKVAMALQPAGPELILKSLAGTVLLLSFTQKPIQFYSSNEKSSKDSGDKSCWPIYSPIFKTTVHS